MSDFEVDTVQDEGLRGHSDGKVIMRARLNSKTIVTCDTDYLLEHWMTTNGVLVLWGRLGNKRFVRLTKKERKVVVPVLFHTHRLKIEEIRDQDLVRFAILSGNDLNDFKWEIRPPTDEELTRYFTKYVEKERALPFPPEESSPLSQIP
ncbi:hypothetical protein BC938DRAFT_481689 [Jimgerdemannia flammicorona]|nr:hypothetical protein BC938DRAFT_481689 [Jimgerdemannia flammicorona]